MNHSLADALQQLNLEPGTYRCELPEHEIVVQVRSRKAANVSQTSAGQSELRIVDPVTINESCIMLDPWVEFPIPTGGINVEAPWGQPDPPDIPEIPPYEEGQEGTS